MRISIFGKKELIGIIYGIGLTTGFLMDFRQPMGVATYKTADEMDPELLKALPPKEELQRVFEESSKKEGKDIE